ncbi:MAG: hypothetical protein A3B90_02610 [Candidatus Magasanikbacteria bacterium RIFCSPHIGHO2_02_FULL_41_13]|uniref:Glycosyltransferase RgtA/B/C/D-like domain-containing protein n=1 Tax=Candidatus Magasanikbacteria bacterium RIFCSPHIGHO2_02_FULL_41_13 TaxID=1798676 RepID=A0A1F6M560_9BACT|nr:MAG: hypothetical protein A3B90_02610 [Candidatus Magasanikbacteria bacterium RIFCSPHIGHO2_02_FULL_41_13]
MVLLFLAYLGWTGFLWSQILNSVFGIREKYLNIPLGILASLLFLSFGASIFVVWYKITWALIILLYTLGAALPFVLCKKVKVLDDVSHVSDVSEEKFGIFPRRKFLLFCFAAISLLQIIILFLCQTDKVLTSPWQTVHPWYLYNFFLLTLLLGILLFSRISFRLKFLLILGYSLLLHLYLPLSHTMPWGGDVWRMIGVEQKLTSGEAQLPILPTALWNPYKYTYGQLWGFMAVLHKTLGVSLLALHRWFMPLVWGIILPVLAFCIGKLVFSEKKKALFLAAFSSFPFALQAIGSITVSSSFGFLTFLFGLLMGLTYLQENKRWQKRFVFVFAFLLFFGYALYALLFCVILAFAFIMKKYWKSKFVRIALCIFALLFFPCIDLVLGFSQWPTSFSVWNFFKQVFGQFAGWYFARPISSTSISSANILFSHVSENSYVANIFSSFRWPIVLLSIFVAGSLVYALYSIIKKEKNILLRILAVVFFCIAGGYIIGWYVLTGDRVFVRRLDSVFAFLLLIFTLYGIFCFDFSKIISKFSLQKKYIYFFVILTFLSFSATTIYATGPNVRVLSRDEYKAAQYIFSREKTNPNPCVLSDTWLLLALEGVSSGTLVGGGFPITNNFGQKERVKLYNELLKNPDLRILPQISSVMPMPFCYLVLSRDEIDPRTEQRLHDFLGDLVFKSGPVLVWKMGLKKL